MSPPPPQEGAGRQPQQKQQNQQQGQQPLPAPQSSPFAFHGPAAGRGAKTPPTQPHGSPAQVASNGGFASLQAAGSSGSKGLSGNPNMSATSRLQLMKMLKLPMANKPTAAPAGVTAAADDAGPVAESPAPVVAGGTAADQAAVPPSSKTGGSNDNSRDDVESNKIPEPAPAPAPAPTLQRINVSDLFKAKINTPK